MNHHGASSTNTNVLQGPMMTVFDCGDHRGSSRVRIIPDLFSVCYNMHQFLTLCVWLSWLHVGVVCVNVRRSMVL